MKYIFSLFFLCLSTILFSQQKFISGGKITFERKIAQFTLLESQRGEDENDFWLEEFKKVYPKNVTDYYTLEFDLTRSLYKLEREIEENKYVINNLKPIESNYVFQDFSANRSKLKKAIFEKEYQVQDSISNFEWKITGEVRNIAGFECKKAITKICDSVVVVAFYTDEIIVKGGPENFNGLPGMILGIAIPRLALTLFATKLDISKPGSLSIVENTSKSKYVTREQVNKDLQKGLKEWGKTGKMIAWISSL